MTASTLSSLIAPSLPLQPSHRRSKNTTAFNTATRCMSSDRSTVSPTMKRTISAAEARVTLVFALASQAASLSQRLLTDLATETARYVFPKRFESRNLEEALMAVPDLETVKYKVLGRRDQYEIREVQSYYVAETKMPSKTGFDFNGASRSFNVLAEYLFGKNVRKERMEMTTPVYTRKAQSDGEKMEMTTPVITTKVKDQDEEWQMSFVMPAKYGADLPQPKDQSVRIKEVPKKTVAVVTFSGFVTDEDAKQRELKLRDALKRDVAFQVKPDASVEIAQYNPPFTLPFTRRNELAIERTNNSPNEELAEIGSKTWMKKEDEESNLINGSRAVELEKKPKTITTSLTLPLGNEKLPQLQLLRFTTDWTQDNFWTQFNIPWFQSMMPRRRVLSIFNWI